MTGVVPVTWRRRLLIGLLTVLFGVFSALGVWQLYRLSWKLDLIHQVERQIQSPPVSAPDSSRWAQIKPSDAYRAVKISGTLRHDLETLVKAVTTQGAGWWVLTPLVTETQEIVLVNRGFVDDAHRKVSTRITGNPTGLIQIKGLLRLTEPGGAFLRDNQPEQGLWFSRDVMAIGAVNHLPTDKLAPYFIDADKTANVGGWPMGGLTVIHFRNPHLAYALTWFALACLALYGLWLLYGERSNRQLANY